MLAVPYTIDSNLIYILWPGEWVKLESDGANWQVIGRPNPSIANYFMAKGSTINRRYCSTQAIPIAFSTSTTSPALNTLWAHTLVIPKTTKFDTGSFVVTTVSTAGSSRIGVYRDNGNCYPGVLLWDSGAVVTSGAGVLKILQSHQTLYYNQDFTGWHTNRIQTQDNIASCQVPARFILYSGRTHRYHQPVVLTAISIR